MDIKDKKIIYELDNDSRQPLSKIGKKVGLSFQVVDYRVKNLAKDKVILGFPAIVDYKKLGYTAYLSYYRLRNITPEKENTIIQTLQNNPNIAYIIRCEGRWDLAIGITSKNVFELNDILSDIDNYLKGMIKEETNLTHIGSYQFNRNYLLNKKESTKIAPLTGGKVEEEKLNKEELELLGLITKDSRTSIIELAKRLGSTVDKVKYSLKKLNQKKIILNYSILLNPMSMGLSYYRILLKMHNQTKEKNASFIAYCNLEPNIFRVSKSFGNWQYTIEAEIEEEKFRDLLNKLKTDFDEIIEDFEILKVYSVDKMNYLPFL